MGEKKDYGAPMTREVEPQDLSTGAMGAGASATDTGGLDAEGNELGAARPGTSDGRKESKRMDDAEALATE